MAVIYKSKCNICGGSLQYKTGQRTCICEYCGTLQSTIDDAKNAELLLTEAFAHLKKANFEKATMLFDEVLEISSTCSKAYFGKALCHFKLTSSDELIHCEYCWFVKNVSQSGFWQRAIQYSSDAERLEYEEILKAHKKFYDEHCQRRIVIEEAKEKAKNDAQKRLLADQKDAEQSALDLIDSARIRGYLYHLQSSIEEIEKQIGEHKECIDYETREIQRYIPILKEWTIHLQPHRKAAIRRTVEAAQARRVDHEFECISLMDKVKRLRNDYDAIAPSLTPNGHSIGALEAIGLSLNGACFCIGNRDTKPIKWYAIARNANHVLFLVADMSLLTANQYTRAQNLSWKNCNLYHETQYWSENLFTAEEQSALQNSQILTNCGEHLFVLSKAEIEYYLLMSDMSKRFIPLPLCVSDEELNTSEKLSVYDNFCNWWVRRIETDKDSYTMSYYNTGHWDEADNYILYSESDNGDPKLLSTTTAFIRPAMWLDVTKLDLSERVIIEPND